MNIDPIVSVASIQIQCEIMYSENAWRPVCNDDYINKIFNIIYFVKSKVNCVVFPELSVPFAMLSELKKLADREHILIIAGSHYIERKNLNLYKQLFDHQFEEKDMRKSICPLIIPGKKILHIEKIHPSKEEDVGYNEPGMKRGELQGIFSIGNHNFGLLICSDFLNPNLISRINKKAHLVIVPQFNGRMDRFYDVANSVFQNPNNIVRAIVLANATGSKAAGGSALFRNVSRGDQQRFKEKYGYEFAALMLAEKLQNKLTLIKEESILYVKINLASSSDRTPSVWTREQHPIDYQRIPIIHNKGNIVNVFNAIKKADDVDSCIRIATNRDNQTLIQQTSNILFSNIQNLENLTLEEIKERFQAVII